MKQLCMSQALYEYVLDISLREHPTLKAQRSYTANMQLASMQISPEQAQFMQFLLKIIGAKHVLELGTFAGYSALAMALALPDDGKVITCDSNKEWTSHAHQFWQEANQSHKIELRLAPALQTLQEITDQKYTFDFIFIDADKTNYVNYYEYAVKLIKPNGVIAIDNVLWKGKVTDQTATGAQLREIRRINQIIKNDPRVDVSLLTIDDGLFLIRKK